MAKWNKNNTIALLLSVLLHTALIGLLCWIILPRHEAAETQGVLVNIGDIDVAAGTFTPAPTEPRPPATPTTPPEASTPTEEELLTQQDEEAPVVPPPAQRKAKEQPKPKPQKQTPKTNPTAAQEKARQQAEQEKKRQEAISKAVSGAFGAAGKGSGEADAGRGQQGSPDGNVQQGGLNSGVGGYGSYNLSGRSLRGNGLPRPSYTSQVEGRIVIRIVVDPNGKVISTTIAPGTNIEDFSMRESAMQAAKAAQFNPIKDLNNQTGTITYTYRLR